MYCIFLHRFGLYTATNFNKGYVDTNDTAYVFLGQTKDFDNGTADPSSAFQIHRRVN